MQNYLANYISKCSLLHYQIPLFNPRNDLTHLYYKDKLFTRLHKKHTVVREGSGYPRNGASMGMSISVLAYLVMKYIIQFTARLNLVLRVSYDA